MGESGCLSDDLFGLRQHLGACSTCADPQRAVSLAVEILAALADRSDIGSTLTDSGVFVVSRSLPRPLTFGHFVETRFEEDVLSKLRKTGRAPYVYSLRHHILPVIGNVLLSEVTFEMIQRGIVQTVLDAGYSVRTAKGARRVANTVFLHAQRTGHFIGIPPTSGTRFPASEPREQYGLTIPEVKAVLNSLYPPFRVMVLLTLVTGVSLAEVSAMRWKRLNLLSNPVPMDGESLPSRSFAVRETYNRGSFGAPRTEHQRRYVVLPGVTVEALRQHKKVTAFAGPNDLVFTTSKGTAFLPSFLHSRIQPIAKLLGLSSLNWRCFRNTHAILAETHGLGTADRRVQMGLGAAWMMERYPDAEIARKRMVGEAIARSIA